MIHEEIISLLNTEDQRVKKLALKAIYLAQTRRLSAEVLAGKLYQQLHQIIKVPETNYED